VVSNRRGRGLGPSVLRAAAIGDKDPVTVATMPDAVLALSDLFYLGGLQRRAQRGMPVWMRLGAPAATVEANQHGVLREPARQEKEERTEPAAEKQADPRGGTRAIGAASRLREANPAVAGELRAACGQRARGATGEPGGDFGDAVQRNETAQHGPAAADGSNNPVVA